MISSLSLLVCWKPVNPLDCAWENLYRNIMRTITQEKATIHYSITIWYTNLYLSLKQWSYPAAKAVVDKEWETLEKIPAWDKTKVRNKSEVSDEARREGRKVHFASLMDLCHLKNAELETKHQKYKGQSCTPRRHCERWFWILCTIHWARIISITNDGRKKSRISSPDYPGSAGEAADAVSAFSQVKMEDAPKLLKILQLGCPDIWIRPPRHKWPKSWSSM